MPPPLETTFTQGSPSPLKYEVLVALRSACRLGSASLRGSFPKEKEPRYRKAGQKLYKTNITLDAKLVQTVETPDSGRETG
jgi:hypothetical protein